MRFLLVWAWTRLEHFLLSKHRWFAHEALMRFLLSWEGKACSMWQCCRRLWKWHASGGLQTRPPAGLELYWIHLRIMEECKCSRKDRLMVLVNTVLGHCSTHTAIVWLSHFIHLLISISGMRKVKLGTITWLTLLLGLEPRPSDS